MAKKKVPRSAPPKRRDPKRRSPTTTVDFPPMSLALASKIGSMIVHVDEGRSDQGHAFDWGTYDALRRDAEITAFMDALAAKGLLPLRRDAKSK
jgi:hypothetical protein